MARKFLYCLLFVLVSSFSCFAAEAGKGVFEGRWITKQYGPMAGAQVLLFNAANGPAPSASRFLRLPDAGAPVDEEGIFSIELPAGKYYLVMRRKADPSSAGPPEEGEPQYYARQKNGKAKLFTIRTGRKVNIGTISVFEPYKREKDVPRAGMTGIEGTVTDEQGKPVAGVRVFAYETPGMLGMPRYASDKTGADGKYVLNLTSGGSYYLKARTHYGGGRPAEGEFMGSYGQQGEAAAVAVEKGKLVKDIGIRVDKFSSKRK